MNINILLNKLLNDRLTSEETTKLINHVVKLEELLNNIDNNYPHIHGKRGWRKQ